MEQSFLDFLRLHGYLRIREVITNTSFEIFTEFWQFFLDFDVKNLLKLYTIFILVYWKIRHNVLEDSVLSTRLKQIFDTCWPSRALFLLCNVTCLKICLLLYWPKVHRIFIHYVILALGQILFFSHLNYQWQIYKKP